jgi:type VI secretion system protein ImpA
MPRDIETLSEPVSADAPCGVDLEYDPLLTSLDSFRIFGRDFPPEKEPDWRQVRDKSLAALEQSHDLRLLAYLAAAVVRIEGLIPMLKVITVADRWLGEYWDQVFPRVDEDAILRKNALNSFADNLAIVDAVRRVPVVSHRQLGSFSVRDLDLSQGKLTPTEKDSQVPEFARIEATLRGTPPAQLTDLSVQLQLAIGSLNNIVATMDTRAGSQSGPDFTELLKPLTRIDKLLTDHVPGAAANETNEPTETSGADEGPAMAASSVTNIRTRQDAIRALDAVSAFFRSNEPSSPVPLFIERAKRLVAKTFIEVLEDMVPDGVTQAKLIGGIRNDEGQ